MKVTSAHNAGRFRKAFADLLSAEEVTSKSDQYSDIVTIGNSPTSGDIPDPPTAADELCSELSATSIKGQLVSLKLAFDAAINLRSDAGTEKLWEHQGIATK